LADRGNVGDGFINIIADISALTQSPKQANTPKKSIGELEGQAKIDKAIELENSSGFDWEENDDEYEL